LCKGVLESDLKQKHGSGEGQTSKRASVGLLVVGSPDKQTRKRELSRKYSLGCGLFCRSKSCHLCSKKGWEDGIAVLCMSISFLWRLERVCVVSISNAILWTHFVTPRGDQTQQDQTNWVSYYKKEESEELECSSELV